MHQYLVGRSPQDTDNSCHCHGLFLLLEYTPPVPRASSGHPRHYDSSKQHIQSWDLCSICIQVPLTHGNHDPCHQNMQWLCDHKVLPPYIWSGELLTLNRADFHAPCHGLNNLGPLLPPWTQVHFIQGRRQVVFIEVCYKCYACFQQCSDLIIPLITGESRSKCKEMNVKEKKVRRREEVTHRRPPQASRVARKSTFSLHQHTSDTPHNLGHTWMA